MNSAGRRVALVTGASRGIGRAIAVALAARGIVVACFGRDRAALDESARAVRAAGAEASVHVGDVRDTAALEAYAAEAREMHGSIDVVVNNAGIVVDRRPEEMTPAEFADILQVNLVSQFALARAAYPAMREQGGGVVVNLGSLAGAIAFPRTAAYCSSKAAVEGLTRSLAYDWAEAGIRVLCVAPGYVRSDLLKEVVADPRKLDWITRRIPLGRLGEPREIAEFVAFLASDAARYCTGETYYVDGGQRGAI